MPKGAEMRKDTVSTNISEVIAAYLEIINKIKIERQSAHGDSKDMRCTIQN